MNDDCDLPANVKIDLNSRYKRKKNPLAGPVTPCVLVIQRAFSLFSLSSKDTIENLSPLQMIISPSPGSGGRLPPALDPDRGRLASRRS